MTIRKMNQAQRIAQIKIEMQNRQESLERLANKADKNHYLSPDEIELGREHVAWINRNKKILQDFYKPATRM